MTNLLETQRLIIKPPQLADFDDLYALQQDPEVMQYIGQGVRTEAEVRAGLEKAIAHQEKYGYSLGSVFEKVSGQFVGRAGLIHLAYDDSEPNIEVGYALVKSAWGIGYATELTRALIAWGFQHLSVYKLFAVINPDNDRSRHVLEKANMTYVGRTTYSDIEVALYEIVKPNINFSAIRLIPASIADYPIIQNMARFYVYDMSEYMGKQKGWEMPTDGLYECIDFKKYWQDQNSFPFFVRYQDELAGFVIIDKKGSHAAIDFNMAQFYILRKFKHRGIARFVAQQCFNKFPGVWEVMVMQGNEGAYRFWRATIKDYGCPFKEYSRVVAHLNKDHKNIFSFDSRIR